ncbi:sensor histidine kinase [Clostridium estertheticum]|nr:GHKL domain-containing protein [Clostridium estertheticum]
MKNSVERTRAIKHDIKNHLSVLYVYIQKNQISEALQYIKEICNVNIENNEFASSGNINIDSILNFKIEQAKKLNINVNLELKIPTVLQVSSFDLNVILNNLLDNAINAIDKLKDNREIDLTITYKTNYLFIYISNYFNADMKIKNDKLSTRPQNELIYGIGLNNIKNIVKKYNGTLNINYGSRIFSSEVLLYVS